MYIYIHKYISNVLECNRTRTIKQQAVEHCSFGNSRTTFRPGVAWFDISISPSSPHDFSNHDFGMTPVNLGDHQLLQQNHWRPARVMTGLRWLVGGTMRTYDYTWWNMMKYDDIWWNMMICDDLLPIDQLLMERSISQASWKKWNSQLIYLITWPLRLGKSALEDSENESHCSHGA